MTTTCVVCGSGAPGEEAFIRSNVRAFAQEKFAVWRCDSCGSIHARDEVDLAHYYAKYPFFSLPVDWRLKLMYDHQLKRLERSGLRRDHRILDYGCGGGNFVRHLQRAGYENVTGFDEYSKNFSDRAALDIEYDCVLSQDVIEHVPSPGGLLDDFRRLVRPGGVIAVGTPNAAAIDLSRPERYVHALHLPYHRHILSKQALIGAGERRGLKLLRYYPTQYANTLFPFLNSSFYLYYMNLFDNSLDALIEPPRVLPLLLRLPLTLFWGLTGYFFAEETDVMAVFRRE